MPVCPLLHAERKGLQIQVTIRIGDLHSVAFLQDLFHLVKLPVLRKPNLLSSSQRSIVW